MRFSGTEPLARVMVEGPELKRVEHFAHSIAAAIQAELGDCDAIIGILCFFAMQSPR